MTTSVGLNMKFTASTGGLQQGVANAGKSLSQLSSIISQSAQTFDAFSAGNDAAAAAQQRLATDTAFLASAMKTGQITAKQFEEEAAKLATEASNLASAFTEGASVTQKYATEQEKQAAEIARLQSLLDAGAISQETYNRAVYEASGAAKEAADAESEKAKAQQRADAIIRKSMTSEEQYAEQLDELNSLMSKGYLDAGQYAKAQERLASEFNKVEKEVEQTDSAIAKMAGSLRTLVAIEIGKILVSGFSSVSSAVSNMIGTIRQSVGELTKLSAISNTSVEEFQGLATAAASVGIEQDKLADIFKDVGDRVGDFIQTGGGPMADFFEQIAPKVGVTADQFRNLSGPDALQLYVSSLEKAGLSQAEMTFYLEAMSSDLTKLQPLLKNGGEGFNELADRAERLGIILSEDQTSAIKEMNGALGLVYKTFEGIIGQVTANLAPIVTSITEEFLSFVESFQGFGGEGGSGIADALTEGLLDFAEYMASIFDAAIAEFLSFGETMAVVGSIFEFVANTFTAVAETLRVVFNLFEMVGNAIMLGLGKILEGLGSWVSSDLEQAGRDLAASSSAALSQNASEAGDAAAHAFNAALGDRNFGRETEASGGMFGQAVAEARARFGREGGPRGITTPQGTDPAKEVEDIMARIGNAITKQREEEAKAEEKRLADVAKLNEQYAQTAADIEQERLDSLAANTQKALEASDIRSGGIASVIALATGREDPAVAEARKQVRKLDEIRNEIRNLGGTVELVGAA